jgi:hypothetical protein
MVSNDGVDLHMVPMWDMLVAADEVAVRCGGIEDR